jgi:Xaa-Pro dipeptidase
VPWKRHDHHPRFALPRTDRRSVLLGTGALALSTLLPARLLAEIDTSDLSDITRDIAPISLAEREGRIERARHLMRDHQIDAILIEPGASMVYFTGVEWHRSERLTAALLFQKGDPVIVTPSSRSPRCVRPWRSPRRSASGRRMRTRSR